MVSLSSLSLNSRNSVIVSYNTLFYCPDQISIVRKKIIITITITIAIGYFETSTFIISISITQLDYGRTGACLRRAVVRWYRIRVHHFVCKWMWENIVLHRMCVCALCTTNQDLETCSKCFYNAYLTHFSDCELTLQCLRFERNLRVSSFRSYISSSSDSGHIVKRFKKIVSRRQISRKNPKVEKIDFFRQISFEDQTVARKTQYPEAQSWFTNDVRKTFKVPDKIAYHTTGAISSDFVFVNHLMDISAESQCSKKCLSIRGINTDVCVKSIRKYISYRTLNCKRRIF